MKKGKLISFLILIILVIWMIFSYTRPSILVGKSEDDNWSAKYMPESPPNHKGIWKGLLEWQGDNSISSVTLLEFRTSDNVLTSNNEEILNLKPGNEIEFVSIGEQPNNKDYSLLIEWTESGERKKENIIFEEKKRWFILPF